MAGLYKILPSQLKYIKLNIQSIVALFLFALYLFPITLLAQNTKIALRDLDQLQYPLLNGSLCISNINGTPLTVDTSEISIKQNGIPVAFQIRCPEPGKSLSIVQVIDNSGSMSSNIPSVKQASAILIDSMRAGDEMSLLVFSENTRLLQDFTQNKSDLKMQLQLLNASGATAMYDALIEALNMLETRKGRKVIILLSDGADNMSVASLNDVIVKAKSLDVVIYCVGIGAKSAPEQELIRLAIETGGRYFLGKSPDELITIFDELSKKIYSSCCSIDFTVHSCADSLPSLLHIEYKRGNETASFDTLLTFPWRPDTLSLTTVAPDRMAPGDFSFVNFLLDPPISASLPLTYTVDVEYNPNLLALEPMYAIGIGTISQGKNISLQIISLGHIRVSASSFFPAMRTGSLFTLGFRALSSDTSRKVIVKIISADFRQGCPNVMMLKSDTIEICQCVETIPVSASSSNQIVTDGVYSMSVRTTKTFIDRPFILQGEIEFHSSSVLPINVTLQDGSHPFWKIRNDSILVIGETWYNPRSSDSTLLLIDWEVKKTKSAQSVQINIPRFKLWSRCCYSNDLNNVSTILVDGICNKISARKKSIQLKPVFPNPANPIASVTVDILDAMNKGNEPARVRLTLASSLGELVAVITDEYLSEGRHNYKYDVSGLQSGLYCFVLDANGERQIQPFVVVK